MPEAPATRRRWMQFGLRSLLVALTALVFAFGWIAWELNYIREQRAWLRSHPDLVVVENTGPGAPVNDVPPPRIPWWRSVLGDEAVELAIPRGLTVGERAAAPGSCQKWRQPLTRLSGQTKRFRQTFRHCRKLTTSLAPS